MKTHKGKQVFIAVFIAVFTLIMSGMFAPGETAQSESVRLKVLLLPYLSFAPFFIAQEEGFFAEQGLEIEFVKFTGGGGLMKAIPVLIQGDLDVAAGSINAGMINAMVHESALKIVADKGHITRTGCPYTSLLTKRTLIKAEELDKASQLQGRRIAVSRAGTAMYYIDKVLKRFDLSLDDVVIESGIRTSLRSESLEKGQVDFVNLSEPWISRALQRGNTDLWFPAKEIIPDFQFAAIVYGPSLLKKAPELGQRFMIAYLKAVHQYNQGKTERNMEILVQHTQLDRELLQTACWPAIRSDGSINASSVIDFQTWALKKGFLDSLIAEEQFWNNRFIEYANQVLETASQ